MKLRDLSIRGKLAAAFGSLLLLISFLGLMAVLGMSEMNDNSVLVRDNWLPSTRILGNLASAVQGYRLTVVNELFNSEERNRTDMLRTAREKVRSTRASYESKIARGTQDEELMRTFDARWAELEESSTRLLALAASDPDGARHMLYGPNRATYRAVMNALEKDQQFNAAEGTRAADEGTTIYQRTRIMVFATIGLALILAAGLGVILVRAIAKPVNAMTEAMKHLADGRLDIQLPPSDRKDEVGRMASTLVVFRDNAVKARDLQDAAEKVRIAKDRRQAAMDRHTSDFGTTIAGMMESLGNAAAELRGTANNMADHVSRIRGQAASTASAASGATETMSSVAAGAEQMSASINEISKQVSHVTTAVHTAIECASTTDSKVSSMAQAADRVGHVVQLINNIAGQTNLLALNATIEAARAGEAGKGFAVVAGEVKALAAQTAKATDEIGSQIGEIRATTGEAVEAMRAVTNAIGQVEQVATAIAAAVEEQAAATREIASSVQKISGNADETARAMQDVSDAASQADSNSTHVQQASDVVGDTARTLRGEVDQFLRAMANDQEEERRRYERIPGNGAAATLKAPGRADSEVVIENISRGGVALVSDYKAAPGQEITLVLPGSDGPVVARLVRSERGSLALCFRQDATTLSRVDRALDRIGQRTARAA